MVKSLKKRVPVVRKAAVRSSKSVTEKLKRVDLGENRPITMRDYYLGMKTNIGEELGVLAKERYYRKELLLWFVVSLVLCTGMTFLAVAKRGAADLYLGTMLYFAVIIFVLFAFTVIIHSNRTYALVTAFLMLVGVVLQLMLLLPVEEGETASGATLILHIAAGTAAGLLAIPVIDFLIRKLSTVRLAILATVVCMGLYAVLLVFGTAKNGTHNWLSIGGQSMQLTEIARLFCVFSMAVIFAENKWTELKRFVLAGIVLCLNAGGLLLVNELGTLLVLCGVYIALALIYGVRAKHIFVLFLITVVVGGIGFLYLRTAVNDFEEELDSLSCGEVISMTREMAEKAQQGDARYAGIDFGFIEQLQKDYSYGKAVYDASEKTDERFTLDTEEYTKAFNLVRSELKNEHSSLYRLRVDIYEKIKLRIDVMLGKGDADSSYQINAARDAVIVSGWFASDADGTNVPIISSDFVVIYLLLRFGVTVLAVVIICFALLAVTGIPKAICGPLVAEGAIATAFIISIVLSATIEMCSSFGIIPIVGICLPFISKGGTNMLCNLVMTYYVIFACRSKRSYAAVIAGGETI